MKRARKKNSNPENNALKRRKREAAYEYKLETEAQDTFAETEGDAVAKPLPQEAEELISPEIPQDTEELSDEEPADTERRENRGKKLLIFFVSLITICTIFFVSLSFGGFFTGSDGDNEEITQPVDKETGEVNILLVGLDNDGFRTDTIILACYDTDENKIDMLSIPRDTKIRIGSSTQKINAAFSTRENGKMRQINGTIDAVTDLTGLPVNHYIQFSFDAFKNTIDALGGVYFDVPQRMKYSDPVQNLKIDLEKGYQLLDGDKAEQLVRFRRYPDGDIDRVKVQQSFVKAVAEQKLNLSILGNLPEIFGVLKKDIKTDLKISDITRLANNLKELSSENINMHQLPGSFSGPESKISYWIPNMTAIKAMVEADFEETTPSPTASEEPEETPTPTEKPTKKPTATASQTKKPTQKPTTAPAKKPSAAASQTKKPTQTPAATQPVKTSAPAAENPTQKPTEKPTEKPTVRPARPTANVTGQGA